MSRPCLSKMSSIMPWLAAVTTEMRALRRLYRMFESISGYHWPYRKKRCQLEGPGIGNRVAESTLKAAYFGCMMLRQGNMIRSKGERGRVQ